MGLREVYALLGGDYDTMLRRLRNDTLIQNFLTEFLEDEEFGKLDVAFQNQENEAAFMAAHTLKGVAANLELKRLFSSVSQLTEALRGERSSEADGLFQTVKADYEDTIRIIKDNL